MDIDSPLEKIVLRCLNMKPAERYSTAKDLLEALEEWKKPPPSKAAKPKKAVSSEMSKSIFGAHSPIDHEAGHRLVRQAIKKAKEEGRLFEAADIMEEAFNKSPSLRPKYANQVRLWRCGISM